MFTRPGQESVMTQQMSLYPLLEKQFKTCALVMVSYYCDLLTQRLSHYYEW